MYVYLIDYVFMDWGIYVWYTTDCPGPASESAGKSDACAGCPNQDACASAPKGPDPGSLSLSLYLV